MAADLSTTYLGLRLSSPLVASASPLSARLESMRRLEDAGIGAVVMQSLFEEQIEHEELEINGILELGSMSHPEAGSYFPELDTYNTGPDEYLRHVEVAAKALSVPVIGSLNGHTRGGWLRYAQMIARAGAAALELNAMFVPTDADTSAADVEARYLELVSDIHGTIRIPLAVKIGPYFTSLPNFAKRLVEAGAAGIVVFNRYLEPDIDLESLAVTPTLHLSTTEEMRLPLRWIAILRDQVKVSLAATTGIHNAGSALKVLLAGADVAMMASALLANGPDHVRTVLAGMQSWLDEGEFESVEQMKGSMSRLSVPHPSDYERSNYMKALARYTIAHHLTAQENE
jgi:dihydroorotate dehydrogenase (fumarate)